MPDTNGRFSILTMLVIVMAVASLSAMCMLVILDEGGPAHHGYVDLDSPWSTYYFMYGGPVEYSVTVDDVDDGRVATVHVDAPRGGDIDIRFEGMSVYKGTFERGETDFNLNFDRDVYSENRILSGLVVKFPGMSSMEV